MSASLHNDSSGWSSRESALYPIELPLHASTSGGTALLANPGLSTI